MVTSISAHEKMKYIGDIKSVYMMWSEFEFRSGKLCHGWHYVSSLITCWICWKFHNIRGPSDLSKGVCEHKLWNIIKTKKGH